MAQSSFPIVEQPMSVSQWESVTRGIGDGIIDTGGYPYKLDSFDNVNNTALIRVSSTTGEASAILAGFYHRLDADMTISLPAQTARDTLYVVLEYDPVRETSPVELKVLTSLPTTGGKHYLHLWNVTRNANELLTDAAVRMIRPRVAPVSVFAAEEDMPQAQKMLWGTLAVVHGGRNTNHSRLFMAMNTTTTGDESEESWFWKPLYEQRDEAWITLPDTANAQVGSSGHQKMIQRKGKTRRMVGRFNRGTAGSNYNATAETGYLINTLSDIDVPIASSRHIVYGGSGVIPAVVEVSRANREVRLWVSAQCSYIDVGMIQWIASEEA